jgi:serine/threonine protein kinase
VIPKQSLGPYELIAPLGAGGMGEVFRAQDTRLNRQVAIKVLPKGFASDPDRLRRFEQESKTLAALNHPNILTIHDAGVQDGTPFLVSELLEGKTLRVELSSGALPMRRATDYALQIAQGLAAAHGKGIIHRDLKPENIFLTKDCRIKILDFGLAKLQSDFKSQISNLKSAAGEAPTLADSTQPGMVLGTPAYMSPEQVRGEPADHRSDIFAFGCVLYEILSGTRAFRRDTPAESMSAVLKEEPPEFATPDAVPAALERVVRRCMEKNPERRFQSALDLAFALEGCSIEAGSVARQGRINHTRSATLPWLVAAVLAVTLGLVLWLLPRGQDHGDRKAARAGSVRRFDLTLPVPARPQANGNPFTPVISPDGKKIAYANADGLWLRWLDRTAPVQLASGKHIVTPFWSPDSASLGYFQRRELFRVTIDSGRPALVCPTPDDCSSGAGGGAWLTADRIVFGTGSSGLYEVRADGGRVNLVCAMREGESDFHNPSALAAGRGVLFAVHRMAGIDTVALWLPNGQRKDLLQREGSICFYPVYAPQGYVVFQRSDEAEGIWAFPFSLEKMEATGQPVRISQVGTIPSVSGDGTLIFGLFGLGEFAPRQLVWVDRAGKVLNDFGPVMPGLGQQRLSPDGTSVVAAAGENLSGLDIWTISTNGNPIPLSRNPEMEGAPFWWNDGRTIVFARRDGGASKVLAKSADGLGEEQQLFEGLQSQNGSANHTMCLSSSGKYFIAARAAASGKSTTGYFPMRDPGRRFVSFPAPFQDSSTWCLSPDDRFLAYQSVQSGQTEVYVVDFPGFGKREKISREGGRHPVWDPVGKQLFYMSFDGRSLMVARCSNNNGQFEAPEKLFDLPDDVHGGYTWWPSFFDVAPGGERFLMLRNVVEPVTASHEAKPNLLVVQNWFSELSAKP